MSDLAATDTVGLAVVGEGTAAAADLSVVRPRPRASLYADPLSWLVLDAVERAAESYGGELRSAPEGVGHIVVSDQCTAHTMRDIAAEVARGRVSPLRFSGANPGSVLSLTSQLLGFSGPSMTLSMRPERGLVFALALTRLWLHTSSATHVLVTSHRSDAPGHRVTSSILMAVSPQ
ncbi:coronafacic acid synthetase [Streptomyces niveus]|uniref:coronafacic acid synthetase n=1 Tax=Streptomyces niveus TaxID=193462 RepID=UPI0036D42BD8